MSTSPFLRHRNAILTAALTVIALALITVAAISVRARLSAALEPVSHRLLPQAPRLPGPGAWRLRSSPPVDADQSDARPAGAMSSHDADRPHPRADVLLKRNAS